MYTDDFLKRYEAALRQQATANIAVQVLEMQAKLSQPEKRPRGAAGNEKASKTKTEIDKFIETHGTRLCVDDLEMLQIGEPSIDQTWRYISLTDEFEGLAKSTITRWLDSGKLKHGQTSNQQKGARKTIDAISAVALVRKIPWPNLKGANQEDGR